MLEKWSIIIHQPSTINPPMDRRRACCNSQNRLSSSARTTTVHGFQSLLVLRASLSLPLSTSGGPQSTYHDSLDYQPDYDCSSRRCSPPTYRALSTFVWLFAPRQTKCILITTESEVAPLSHPQKICAISGIGVFISVLRVAAVP